MGRGKEIYLIFGVLLIGLIAGGVAFFTVQRQKTTPKAIGDIIFSPADELAKQNTPGTPASSANVSRKRGSRGSTTTTPTGSQSGGGGTTSGSQIGGGSFGNTVTTSYGSEHTPTNPFQGSPCTGGDNQPRINAEISTALSQGKDSYLIPEGSCPINASITIPNGTSNFAIIGAGSTRTVFTSPSTRINNAFELGFSHFTFNNWGLTDLQNRTVHNASRGSNKVTLVTGQVALEPGWHIIWDEHEVINRQNQYPIYNRAEIVEVRSYNPATRQATLDVALGRDFDVNPKIGPVNGRLAHNITLKGVGFDGTSAGGQYSMGGLYASMIRNLTIDDVAVKKFSGPALSVMLSRNIDVKGVRLSENIGSYGLGINKSRFADVHDSFASSSVTTAFIGHTGAQDVIFRRLTTPRVDASHGFDEQRITVKEITGNATDPLYPGETMADLTCGNLAWRDGIDGCYIQNTASAHEVFSGPNARNVLVDSVKMHVLRINDEDGIGPISTTIKNSEIKRKGIYNWVVNLDWFHPDTKIGRVEIDNTKIINDDPNGNFVIKGTSYIGELIIKNSQIINNSNRGYEMVYLATNRDSKLSITNTLFRSGSSDKAIYLSGFLNPCAEIRGNTYQVVGANPTQFVNTTICP